MEMSSAERQERYREKQRRLKIARKLNTWLNKDAFDALGEMAKREKMSKRVVLQHLLLRYWNDMVFSADLKAHQEKPVTLKGKKGAFNHKNLD